MRRGKRFDYYTSCLPFPQAGPGVEISLGGNAPVYANDGTNVSGIPANSISNVAGAGRLLYRETDGNWPHEIYTTNAENSSVYAGNTFVYADLKNIYGITINTLREAFAMQQFLERLAVGGNRYTEIVYSMFGVKSPDARLQRPEFLGHGQARININPVEQTAQSSEASPQGNLAAYAVFRNEHHAFSYQLKMQ